MNCPTLSQHAEHARRTRRTRAAPTRMQTEQRADPRRAEPNPPQRSATRPDRTAPPHPVAAAIAAASALSSARMTRTMPRALAAATAGLDADPPMPAEETTCAAGGRLRAHVCGRGNARVPVRLHGFRAGVREGLCASRARLSCLCLSAACVPRACACVCAYRAGARGTASQRAREPPRCRRARPAAPSGAAQPRAPAHTAARAGAADAPPAPPAEPTFAANSYC